MKRWLAVLFITVMADVHAAWVPYGETELVGNIYYIDPDTLRKSEAGYIFNILSNYSVPIRESFATFQSVQSQVELDCRHRQLREIFINFHQQPMGKGRVVHTERGQGNFIAWPPGSVNELLYSVVCQ